MVPKDIHMLVSFLNAKLRDDDMSLEQLLEINDCDQDDVMRRLRQNDYFYNVRQRQIKRK